MVARATIPDGWNNFAFTCILQRSTGSRYELAYFRRWEPLEKAYGASHLVFGDFDSDGLPEMAETTSWVGGWIWETLRLFNATCLDTPLEMTSRAVESFRGPDGRPIFAMRRSFNPTRGGKASYLTTSLATQRDVHRMNSDGTLDSARVLTRGNGW